MSHKKYVFVIRLERDADYDTNYGSINDKHNNAVCVPKLWTDANNMNVATSTLAVWSLRYLKLCIVKMFQRQPERLHTSPSTSFWNLSRNIFTVLYNV
jgi:hypothetical protein